MGKQDFETRRQRLLEGGCPVHGIGVTQTGDFYLKEDGSVFAIFSCPRNDCDITIRGNPSKNFWEATPETAPLVGLEPKNENIYSYDEITDAFGRIDPKLAIRAYQHMKASGLSPREIVEAALTLYLDSHS